MKTPDSFHLDLSKYLDAQSQNETVEFLEDSYIDNLHPRVGIDENRNLQSSLVFGGLDTTSESDEDAMMNFHKEILYAEFRNMIRAHPHGGEISVDSTKLRILLDLMRRQSFRLEQQVRYFMASVPDPNGTPSSPMSASASASASASSEDTSHYCAEARQAEKSSCEFFP